VNPVLARTLRSLQRNILAGIITIGPLFVTYLIFSFLLSTLAKAGLPVIKLFAVIFPEEWLSQPWLQSIMAIVLTLVMLYVVGRVTSLVVGRQALVLFETALDRLPVVAKIYSSVRQLIDSMMAKKESSQRVVLVDFPIPGQKSIGFLTRTLTDETTGELRHQPDLGLIADSADDAGHRDRPEYGAGDEHDHDRRRRGAGDDPLLSARAGRGDYAACANGLILARDLFLAAIQSQSTGSSTASASSACSLSAAILRRLTCSNCAQIRPMGAMPRKPTSSSVAAQAVAASGATPKKFLKASSTTPICVNQPITGN
jgi:uncharacterized membrane protein